MTQLPAAVKVTMPGRVGIAVELGIEHTAVLEGAMAKTTGLPEAPPDAITIYTSPGTGLAGGVEVKEIACAIFVPEFTVIACWAWCAGWYFALPTWLASMTQLPPARKVTVWPMIEHTAVLEGAMAKTTGLPEVPPNAVTIYTSPGTGRWPAAWK